MTITIQHYSDSPSLGDWRIGGQGLSIKVRYKMRRSLICTHILSVICMTRIKAASRLLDPCLDFGLK